MATPFATKFVKASSQYLAKTSGIAAVLPIGSAAREFEFYYTPVAFPLTSGAVDHFFMAYADASSHGFAVGINNNAGVLTLTASNIWQTTVASSAITLSLGVRYRLRWSHDGTNVSFYVNEKLISTTALALSGGAVTQIYIGAGPGGTWAYCDMYAYDMRIHNAVLTQAQRVANNAGGARLGSCVAQWCVDNSANDATGSNNLTNTNAATYVKREAKTLTTGAVCTGTFYCTGQTYLAGLLYNFGGYNGTSFNAVSYAYDPIANSWATKASMPVAKATGVTVNDGNFAYNIGGNVTTASANVVATNYRYDPMRNIWDTMATMPVALWWHQGSYCNGKIHIFGGINSSGTSVAVHYIYDIATDTWSTGTALPFTWTNGACATVGTKIYLTGGVWNGGAYSTTCYVYDTVADTYTAIASLPAAKIDHNIGAVGNFIYAFSGATTGYVKDGKTYQYDIALNVWVDTGIASAAQAGGGSGCDTAGGDMLYQVGGYTTVVSNVTSLIDTAYTVPATALGLTYVSTPASPLMRSIKAMYEFSALSVLTSYEGSNDDYNNIGTTSWGCQGFTPSVSGIMCAVEIYGSRGNSASGTFSLRILKGATPSTATLILTKTFTTTVALSAYGSPLWNTLEFDRDIALVGGAQYFLEVRPLTGSTNDEVRWSTDTTSPSYAGGTVWLTTNGTSWTEYANLDKNFRISATTPLADAVGSSTIVNNNGVTWATGLIGQGANFGTGNTNKYLQSSALVLPSGSFAAVFAFKLNTDAAQGLLSWNDNVTVLRNIQVTYNGSAVVFDYHKNNASDNNLTWSSGALGIVNWHTIAFAHDGSNLMVYADGLYIGSLAISGAGTGTVGSAGLSVGQANRYASFANAVVDNVVPYNRSITYDEYLAHYNGNLGLPYVTSLVAPTVTESAGTSLTGDGFTGNGNITDIGSGNATERGFVWDTVPRALPTTDPATSGYGAYWSETGSYGTGAFTHAVTGLNPHAPYYVRAYAKNAAGYSYSAEVVITTAYALAAIGSMAQSNLLDEFVTFSANITAAGGGSVLERGFMWGATSKTAPTSTTHDGSTTPTAVGYDHSQIIGGPLGLGAFSYDVSGLTALHTYYARAYVKNEKGYQYSAEISFTTATAINYARYGFSTY